MLTITILGPEYYNAATQEFSYPEARNLDLEHSLVSLSKWESKYEKPFLSDDEKTPEEIFDYIKMMVLTPDFPETYFDKLSEDNVKSINDYITSKQTATWFKSSNQGRRGEVITNELIYYWMTALNIDKEYETWHLNRLFTFIRVCNEKQTKPKPMSPAERAAQQRKLNEQRKREMGTSG